MSEVRLVVRESMRDWSGTIHGSDADRAIAALSADPVTIEEFEVATARFSKPSPDRRFFSNLRPGLNDESYDAGLVVIDLVARLIVVESTYSAPSANGSVDYHCGHRCTDISLDYHLADDWKFMNAAEAWRHVAEMRRRERALKPVFDARTVFYGKPLLEFVARETFAAFSRRDAIAATVRALRIEEARNRLARQSDQSPDQVDPGLLTDEEVLPGTWPGQENYTDLFYDTLKQIHAAWLLTPRNDLGGISPREIALDRHRHLVWDLQDRCMQWSRMQACPRGLDESSYAYRYGGFGTHELVMYYDLVRKLLWSSWERLIELAQVTRITDRPESLLVGDFLTNEIQRLERVRDAWLDTPNSDTRGRTPRSIIDRERLRLPETMSGKDAMVDLDCPCCQMMGEMSGPWFWHYDGCNNDDEFAFDTQCLTREEWDKKQRDSEEFNRRWNAEWKERERLGVKSSTPQKDGSNAIWSTSFSIGDNAEVPLGVRVFGIGCQLAELIVGLRAGADRESVPPETRRHIDSLNCDFGNLRELLQSTDSSLVEALIDPVRDRFSETLANIALERPDLAEQCEDVTDELKTLLAPQPPSPTWDSDDLDVPF